MSNAADYVGAARKLENVVHNNLTDSLQVRKPFSPFTQGILSTHLTIVLWFTIIPFSRTPLACHESARAYLVYG